MLNNLNLYKGYYHCLAKSGSYWGKKILKDSSDFNKYIDFSEIRFCRINYRKYREKTDSIKIYDLSEPFLFIKKWVLTEAVIPYLAIPVITAMFYFPLHLLSVEHKQQIITNYSSEKFIVTEEFIDQATTTLQPLDIVPPAPPMGLRIQ